MSSPTNARLEVRGLSKTFGSNRALRNADLTVAAGEIHAIVGQNGSGKSTLIKILAGYHAPQRGGSVSVDGHPLHLPIRPREVRRHGVSVVHQDLGLVGDYSVVENMRVGSFGVRRLTRSIRWRAERELACAALAELGSEIDPRAKVDDLSAAERATVAIARALQHHEPSRGLIMFDEVTRALPKDSREHFHELIRGVADRSGSILLVTHQLEEVLAYADRVTVLRDGEVVGHGIRTREIGEHELIRLMLGYELGREAPRARIAEVHHGGGGGKNGAGPRSSAKVVMRGVTGRLVRDATITVRRGEVLGLTGLLGSGFEELPYLIAGARPASVGTLDLGDGPLDLPLSSTRDLLSAGVALVPERRDRDGLSMEMSLLENVTLPRVSARGSRGRIGTRWQREEASWVVRELGVRPADTSMPVGHLSGGNQQKVLLGKWLKGEPRLLVLHEPTQGVDVGARLDLVRAIRGAADSGCAVILAGMDAGELAAACDRVVVMRDGRLGDELDGELSFERIVDAVYGGERRVASEH